MKEMIRASFAVLVLCLLCAAAPSANLIRNGSFESPNLFHTPRSRGGANRKEPTGNARTIWPRQSKPT
jgi:hypothetical protein